MKEPPRSWEIAPLDAPMPYGGGATYILLWEILDYRSGVREKCLVLTKYPRPRDGGYTSALASFYGKRQGERQMWTFGEMHSTPVTTGELGLWELSQECYKGLPTDKEIDTFLTKWAWPNAVEPPVTVSDKKTVGGAKKPRLRDGGINGKAWKKAFGREPTMQLFSEKRYPELTAQQKEMKKG